MLLIRQILVRALVLAAGTVATATLVGCGQRGPLYMPTEAAAANRATLPVSIASERATNPFLRVSELRPLLGMEAATDAEVFARLRAMKDRF